jgi:hypothetical protein
VPFELQGTIDPRQEGCARQAHRVGPEADWVPAAAAAGGGRCSGPFWPQPDKPRASTIAKPIDVALPPRPATLVRVRSCMRNIL